MTDHNSKTEASFDGSRKEGTVQGIGGVIEVTKSKFGVKGGTRLMVVGQKPTLWHCEGGKTIPKFNTDGWRLVMKDQEEKARQQKQQEDEEKRKKMEEDKVLEKQRKKKEK